MSDKHSLAEDSTHSLSEIPKSLDKSARDIGIYPNEDEECERFRQKEKQQEDNNSLKGWVWILVFWIGFGLIALIAHFFFH